ncbi:MAG TPA: cobyric acid synthase [Dehalococcoidia bacterium]|nr:cobyric acid synthase [Dehalococcoidia bacterium]
MQAKTLMIQGTASSVGKSVLVTALCRIFRQDGFSVAPFKAQNMALNSFITREGGEMGRAQVVQAEAAGIEPSVDMNPVLLKPEADARSQVIVHGKVIRTISAQRYYHLTRYLLKMVEDSLDRLRSTYDIVVIEGAGSPAEINLTKREIVNMRIAKMAHAPVLLVGDIDKGGVFASLVGTLDLLEEDERNYIKGFIINKFRGDISLLRPGLELLEKRTAKPVFGVVPYFRGIAIAQEDSVYLEQGIDSTPSSDLDIAIIHLPHISNYDDFDPLEEEGCRVHYVAHPSELGTPDFIILPGTKSTISDLTYLWRSGLAESILQQARNGTPVVGICGGYQMLGRSLHDPDGVESAEESVLGLGLLDVVTTFIPEKATTQVKARVVADRGLLEGMKGQELVGYEIHMGRTKCDGDTSAFNIFETPQGRVDYFDGTLNEKGKVLGTYMHGLFHNSVFRGTLLNSLRRDHGLAERHGSTVIEKAKHYDKLAELVRHSLDISTIYRIVEEGINE